MHIFNLKIIKKKHFVINDIEFRVHNPNDVRRT